MADVRYAKTGDNAHLAYVLFGSGAMDVVEVGNGTTMSFDAAPDQPQWEAYVERLGGFARVIRFDPRGIGLSDPLSNARPTAEGWADDTVAVMDAAGAADAALIATGHAGMVAVLMAATRPERVRALVLINAFSKLLRAPDYRDGLPAELFADFVEGLVEPEPQDAAPTDDLPLMAPSRTDDVAFREWWRAAGHRGASPAMSRLMHRLAAESDVRALLPRVQAPTLVLHSADNHYIRAAHGRYLADHIPSATYAEMHSEPGQTLVSRTITDLAAGSGIDFDDHGEHHLKGLDGTWHLYRAIHHH